jgi:hypothetical protein
MQAFFGLKIQLPIEDDPDEFSRAYRGDGICGH